MKNKQINWNSVSKNDLESDFSFFLNFYNFDIKQHTVNLQLKDIQSYGVQIETKTTSEIKKSKYCQLNNHIIYYSNPSSGDVKELIRHFKNLVSHPQNVKKTTINNVLYYRLYDINKAISKESMKGVVEVKIWKSFAMKLIADINNHLK